jgi:hypothetical protein
VNSEWIDDASNCLEIQGRVWLKSDGGDGVYVDLPLVGEADPVCMAAPRSSATLPTVLGFNLNQTDFEAQPRDYDAKVHGVVGFRITITDGTLSGMRFPFMGVISNDEVYCIPVPGFGAHEVHLADLSARCWENTNGPSPDPEHIRTVVLYMPVDWPGETIAMCVALTALSKP